MLGKDSVRTKVMRTNTHTITMMKDGYETRQVFLEGRIQPGYLIVDIALCFVVVGIVAIIVDGATGSWMRLEPGKVDYELEKK